MYGKKALSLLYPTVACMDTSLTEFYRVGQKVSDVILVLRLTPIATEPSAVSVFLASPSAIAYVGRRPAHILA